MKKIKQLILALLLLVFSAVVYAQTDIAINRSGPAGAHIGSQIQYNLHVSNPGATNITNAVIKEPAIANLSSMSIVSYKVGDGTGGTASFQGTPTITQLQGSGVVISSLPSGSGVVLTIQGTVGNTSSISSTSTVSLASGTDANPGNNTATAVVNVYSSISNQTVYKLDTDKTLTKNGGTVASGVNLNANGGTINLWYTLDSGTAVPGIGNEFSVPVTYTKPTGNRGGSGDTWDKMNVAISATVGDKYINLALNTTTMQGGIYYNLPSTNTQNMSGYPYPNNDGAYTSFIKNNYIATLGLLNINVGSLPTTPAGYIMTENSLKIFSNGNSKNTLLSGFWLKPLISTEINSNASSRTPLVDVAFKQTYTYRYTASLFTLDVDGSVATNGNGIRGVSFSDFSTVTFAKATTNHCVSGDCNGNTFLNTSDSNTIEYDNLISGYHGSIAKQTSGNYLIWGQGAAANGVDNLLAPTEIIPANGYNYTGKALKVAMGTTLGSSKKAQYALLTSDGLYSWGEAGILLNTGIKSDDAFNKIDNTKIAGSNAYGLPGTVKPEEVKMMFGAFKNLSIITCTGNAYVLSSAGNKNGDGSLDSDYGGNVQKQWHQVMLNATTPLTNVVALRGQTNALVALTDTGELYTWGTDVYLGDGNAKSNKLFATKMTLPTGVTPKMIGMTSTNPGGTTRNNSYYLLATNGNLYSLGANDKKQLGIFSGGATADESRSWVNVKSTNATTNMTNIAWISPNEHDDVGMAVVQALTTDGKLWSWGVNHYSTLGYGDDDGNAPSINTGYSFLRGVNPRYMTGGLDSNDKILAVETGGHISTIFKDCDYKLGYIGHNSSGSYATPSTISTNVYLFNGAKLSNLCALPLPPLPEVQDLRTCAGNTVDLSTALLDTPPAGYVVEWYTTPTRIPANKIDDITTVGPGTYYVFYWNSTLNRCINLEGEKVVVSYYTSADPGYNTCVCFNDPVTTGASKDTKVGITLLKRAGEDNSDNWPMVRKGGFIALESNTQGFVPTRMATADLTNITNPQKGMMVYDTTDKCLKIYVDSTTGWKCFSTPSCPDDSFSLSCSSATVSGDTHADPNVNFTITIPYVGGDSSAYPTQSFTSTDGLLTAVLPAGNFSNGAGNLVLTVTGSLNNGAGLYFPITIKGKTCVVPVTITMDAGGT